jgi:hypothetical protein
MIYAWLIGMVVVILMALAFCRRPCKRCKLRDACDMADVTGRE